MISVMPTMAFIGVRISWDMLERKLLLASLASFAASTSERSFHRRRLIQSRSAAPSSTVTPSRTMAAMAIMPFSCSASDGMIETMNQSARSSSGTKQK